jgi:DnaK suppressor protein
MLSGEEYGRRIINQIHALLETERANILRSVRRFDAEGRALQPDCPQDVGERSVLEYSKEFLFTLSNDQRKRLRAIDAALYRIQTEAFGVCAACEGEIGSKRLQAVPWAELCVKCQEKQKRGELALEPNMAPNA